MLAGAKADKKLKPKLFKKDLPHQRKSNTKFC